MTRSPALAVLGTRVVTFGAQMAIEEKLEELEQRRKQGGHLKHHTVPSYCAHNLGELARRASPNQRSMQRHATLVRAVRNPAELF
jgi:hypothetical protein